MRASGLCVFRLIFHLRDVFQISMILFTFFQKVNMKRIQLMRLLVALLSIWALIPQLSNPGATHAAPTTVGRGQFTSALRDRLMARTG